MGLPSGLDAEHLVTPERPCLQCGKPFLPDPPHRKLCGEACRRERARTNAARPDIAARRKLANDSRRMRQQPEPDADGEDERPLCCEVNQGADYTAAEVAFLKRVDLFRKTKPFPAATDYFRLARQVLLPETGQGVQGG